MNPKYTAELRTQVETDLKKMSNKEVFKKYPQVTYSTICHWRFALKEKKQVQEKKEPSYQAVAIKNPPSKKVFVLYSEDTESLIETLKGIL